MKSIRLKNYDYSSDGIYFITICSYNKKCIFGNIVGQGLCSCRLTRIGEIVQAEIEDISRNYPTMMVDNYIIMPNHIHLLVSIKRQEQSPCPTISDMICALKSKTTKRANCEENNNGRLIWQRSFYDHIVRDEVDYEKIWNYIEYNVSKWNEDKYFI